ncbi:MAG: hypothetical protein WCA78_10660 [Rhizomicrobium sp.]
MFSTVKKIDDKIIAAGNRWQSYATLFLLFFGSGGIVSTFLKFTHPFFPPGWGWPEAIVLGFGVACVLVVIAAFALIAIRFFKPLTLPKVYDDLVATAAAVSNVFGEKPVEAELRTVREQVNRVENQNQQGLADLNNRFVAAIGEMRNSLQKEIVEVTKANSASHWDLLRLLDWALNRASSTVIRMLAEECPIIHELECPLDATVRNGQMDEAQAWVRRVESHVQSSSFRYDILSAIPNAKLDGEAIVKQLQPDQRPPGIDPYVFRDFFVVAHQCNLVRKMLKNVLREIDNNELSRLQQLRVQFSARHKP